MQAFKSLVRLQASATGNSLKTDPSNTHSSNETSGKISRVLTFRTITTLLHLIQQQQEQPLEVTDMKPQTAHDRLHLSILNAIATLAVTQHEVVAVTAKYTDHGLELVASANGSEAEEPRSSNHALKVLQDLLITWNPAYSNSSTSISDEYPTLAKPSKPANLKDETDAALLEYLEEKYMSGICQ